MKATLKLSRRVLVLAALLLAAAAMLRPDPAGANVTVVYGVAQQNPIGTYRASIPVGARPVLIGNRRLYLSEGIYWEAVMLQGRVVYRAVDTTWQR